MPDLPTSRRYTLDGRDVSTLDRDQLAQFRNNVAGFVFQGHNLLPRDEIMDQLVRPEGLIWLNDPVEAIG